MKLIYIFILSLFLFSCSNSDSGMCINQGQLCSEYQEEYFKCKHYEYYNQDVYGHTYMTYVHIWYKIKNIDGDWTYWDDYSEMRYHYCSIDEEEDL